MPPEINSGASPWALPAFRWFFTGRVVSLLGTSMVSVALAFAVLQEGRPDDLGLVLAAESVPLVVFLLFGGVIADRFPRRVVLLCANLGAGVAQGAVAVLFLTDSYHLPAIMALEFVNGASAALTLPAMMGIVPEIVAKSQAQRANSLLGSSRNAVTVAGPAVAGLLVAGVGGGWAIAIDAATYFVAAFCLTRVRLPKTLRKTGSGTWADLREGWREFRSRSWVWTVVASFGIINCVSVAVWSVLGPRIAERTIGSQGWGLVLSVHAAGLLVMSIVMYRLVVRRLLALGLVSISFAAVPLFVLGFEPSILWLSVGAFIGGLGMEVFAIAWATSIQQHIPENVLSRVTSYDALGSFVAIPIGQLLVGPAVSAAGEKSVAIIGGALFFVAALVPLAWPSVRGLSTMSNEPAPAG
ncbi:MFS transporter [Phytomonospora sp. NPDC050363]|uniref:MFS transporter n=1 Tax=Phytomonospora sp. NPDC050363 TaxID=3155642 RepID=UPI00340DB53B